MWAWFGPTPEPISSAPWPRTETPIGKQCAFCCAPFTESDRGFVLPFMGASGSTPEYYHQYCLLRTVLPEMKP